MQKNYGANLIVFLFFGIVNPTKCLAQDTLTIAFYNVENLFDTLDNPETIDEEYLPWGMKKWGKERYWQKERHLARNIVAMNNWQGPDFIGLCEVESRNVLNDLTTKTVLKKQGYKIIHRDSPDLRGIDVAAIYKFDRFHLLSYDYISVTGMTGGRPTRDILYVKGAYKKDTIHTFVNHWPSRFGGQAKSEAKRVRVAYIVKHKIDSIVRIDRDAKIIVTGDFNDGPENKSLRILAKTGVSQAETKLDYPGTHKFQYEWNQFDQMYISYSIQGYRSYVFSPPWITMPDEKFTGDKPFRTFSGPNYLGGYSDHFAIVLKIPVSESETK